jgi:Tfp pilus assembly protein PilF
MKDYNLLRIFEEHCFSSGLSKARTVKYVLTLRKIAEWLKKDFDKAESLFKEVLKENPKNAMVLNYIGYMLADRGIEYSCIADERLGHRRGVVEVSTGT